MNTIKNIYNRIYTPRVREIGRIFFYIALAFEIVIFLLDRADWYNPYQSMMFRVTFVLFLVKCVCTKYTPREWAFIIVCAAFCILAYSISIKDEIIRAMVFIIAMKEMDVRRTLKFSYFLTLAGIILLGLMSVLGIMGDVLSPFGYGDKSDVMMLSLGLGSSNTLGIQIWLLVMLGVYVYHKRLDTVSYVFIMVLGVAVYLMTRCRTALMMIFFTALSGLAFYLFPKLKEKLWVYVLGIVLILLSVAFSVYAAAISGWFDDQSPFQLFLNKLTTGRIMSIYPFENGGGVLSNWRLFAAPDFDRYFDMGIVRLFWWYGIIPGTLAFGAVIILFIYQYRRKDHAGFIMTLSIILFSVLEAHFISPFLSRAYILFLIGGAWYRILAGGFKAGGPSPDTRAGGGSSPDTRAGGGPSPDTHTAEDAVQRHIAFYIGSLTKGGAERVFVNLASYFLSVGYSVTMITQYKYDDEYDLPEGAVRVISDLSEEECRGRAYNFFARILKLHRIIRDTDADLLMTTIGKANFMAVTCAAFTRTRVVVSVVADPPLEYPTRTMRFLAQTLFGEADGIIMQTERQRNFLRKGLRREAVILPNSVNPLFIRDRYTGRRDKNIYMVGRMDDNKNQEMAIRAFADSQGPAEGFRLVIAGDGPDRERLEQCVKDCGMEAYVDMPGIVSDVPDRLERAYAFVLASDTEGMPNTLLEAMSIGTACISTDCPCGGPAQLIEEGRNGLLVPVRDITALKEALDRLIADPGYTEKLGEAAYESMRSYRPDAVNPMWRDYYVSIIDR